MSFADAVRTCLTGYATFSGRARRSEYWWFSLFFAVVYFLAAVVGTAAHVSILGPVAILALLLPIIAVSVRRLHDTNRSGWWYLISLVPLVGGIVMLVFCVKDSDAGPNAYGPCPKDVPVPATV